MGAALAASVLLGASALAQQSIIYENSANFLGFRTDEDGPAFEIGDEVVFAGTANERLITEIKFEYFLSPGASGNEMAELFIRAMNGPTITGGKNLPGDILFRSTPFSITPGSNAGYGTVTVRPTTPFLAPDNITWTVAFSGLEGAERAGLLFYNPPTIGSSPTFDPGTGPTAYTWLNKADGSGWALVDHPTGSGNNLADNLGAQFVAVPEPSTWALILGGLGMFSLIRRRKE